jgi:hypothetical protein
MIKYITKIFLTLTLFFNSFSFASGLNQEEAKPSFISRGLIPFLNKEEITIKINATTRIKCGTDEYSIKNSEDIETFLKEKGIDPAKIEVHSQEHRDETLSRLNTVLGALSKFKKLKTLAINADLINEGSIESIGAIAQLTSLFLEGHEGSNHLIMKCLDYSSLTLFENLQTLALKKVEFLQDSEYRDFASKNKDIPFISFAESLKFLPKLQELDLTGSTLFPSSLPQKSFNGKGAKNALNAYHEWRQQQIKASAELLAQNFHGKKLLMQDTRLGDLFVGFYGKQLLEQFYLPEQSRLPEELDFSNNYISINEAADFIEGLRKTGRAISINLSEQHDPEKGKLQPSFLDDLREHLLNGYLGDITLAE